MTRQSHAEREAFQRGKAAERAKHEAEVARLRANAIIVYKYLDDDLPGWGEPGWPGADAAMNALRELGAALGIDRATLNKDNAKKYKCEQCNDTGVLRIPQSTEKVLCPNRIHGEPNG